MIVDLLIYVFSLMIDTIVLILPTWTVWPQSLLDGLNYLAQSMAKFNFILPVDTFFACVQFFILFETLYLTTKILLKFFGFVRKSESLNL
jgi:hypothetical protein